MYNTHLMTLGGGNSTSAMTLLKRKGHISRCCHFGFNLLAAKLRTVSLTDAWLRNEPNRSISSWQCSPSMRSPLLKLRRTPQRAKARGSVKYDFLAAIRLSL